jgi:uncharacterized protein (TIGR03437 family)
MRFDPPSWVRKSWLMKRVLFAALSLGGSCLVHAQSCDLTERPRITAIVNAASFQTGPVAVNSIITLHGANFQKPGQSRAAGTADLADGRFPTELACVSVDIGGRRAPLIYVDPTQINAQVPTFGDPQDLQVRVVANPGRGNEIASDPAPLQIVEQAPAFFRLLPTPCIAAVFPESGQISGDPALLPNVRGARVGEIVVLFATGLGFTDPVWQSGEIPSAAAQVTRRVQIEVNGVAAPDDHVLYSGLVPQNISGLYQINLRIPPGMRANSHNTVRLRIGERLSADSTTLYIAP